MDLYLYQMVLVDKSIWLAMIVARDMETAKALGDIEVIA